MSKIFVRKLSESVINDDLPIFDAFSFLLTPSVADSKISFDSSNNVFKVYNNTTGTLINTINNNGSVTLENGVEHVIRVMNKYVQFRIIYTEAKSSVVMNINDLEGCDATLSVALIGHLTVTGNTGIIGRNLHIGGGGISNSGLSGSILPIVNDSVPTNGHIWTDNNPNITGNGMDLLKWLKECTNISFRRNSKFDWSDINEAVDAAWNTRKSGTLSINGLDANQLPSGGKIQGQAGTVTFTNDGWTWTRSW